MFIVKNESFECQNCGHKNEKLSGSCRNHCQICLFSQHLDESFPGDRNSSCKSLMQPVNVYQNKKKGWMILHHCTKCQKEIPNKVASDDNFEQVIKISINKDEKTKH